MGDTDVYPMLLDMTKDDCRRLLRHLELEAYSNLVSALRAQGSLSTQKRKLLQTVAQTLSISVERHKAECRRAVNSEKLTTIAKYMEGPNTATEWAIEGRRLVPLMPRLVPQTAFTVLSDHVANMAATEKARPIEKNANAGMEECALEEPSVPEASKTEEMCISPTPMPMPISTSMQMQTPTSTPAPTTTSMQMPTPAPTPKPSLTATIARPEPLSSPNTVRVAQKEPCVILVQGASPSQTISNNGDRNKESLNRKRDRATSLDSCSGEISASGPATVLPHIKKEIEEVKIARTSPATQPVVTPSQPPVTAPPATLPENRPISKPTPKVSDDANPPAAQPRIIPREPQTPSISVPQSEAQPPTPVTTTSTTRAVVLPSHAAVKLALAPQNRTSLPANSSAVGSNASGVASTPTQKVIIVSSTAPSILQRSLSVPIVKAGTTAKQSSVAVSPAARSQALTATQSSANVPQPQQHAELASVKKQISAPAGVIPEISTTTTPTTVKNTTAVPAAPSAAPQQNAGSAATSVAPAPAKRPRGNSIVIPMTLNQQGAAGGSTLSNVHLKTLATKSSTLHLKQDSAGVKIMPIASVGGTAKMLSKGSGSQMFLVSSAPGATPTVSMVTRTVPAGTRVMTVSNTGVPRAAVGVARTATSGATNVTTLTTGSAATSSPTVATSRPTAFLSMTPKPGQTVQLGVNSGNVVTGATASKPNVIVVQKNSNRGVTLTHGAKEVVGKVLLGKTVSAQSQNAAPGSRPAVTVQKVTNTSTMLQATSGSQSQVHLPVPAQGNVIVLDLSQEHLTNNAVLNELLQASGLISSSGVWNVSSESTATNVISTPSTSSIVTSKGPPPVASPPVIVQPVAPPPPSGMDIFSAALSAADINFDNFQYLGDSGLDGLTSHLAENNSNSSSAEQLDIPMDLDSELV